MPGKYLVYLRNLSSDYQILIYALEKGIYFFIQKMRLHKYPLPKQMFQYHSSITRQFYNVKHSNKMDTILFQVFKDQINIEWKTSIQTLTFVMWFQV